MKESCLTAECVDQTSSSCMFQKQKGELKPSSATQDLNTAPGMQNCQACILTYIYIYAQQQFRTRALAYHLPQRRFANFLYGTSGKSGRTHTHTTRARSLQASQQP